MWRVNTSRTQARQRRFSDWVMDSEGKAERSSGWMFGAPFRSRLGFDAVGLEAVGLRTVGLGAVGLARLVGFAAAGRLGLAADRFFLWGHSNLLNHFIGILTESPMTKDFVDIDEPLRQ